MNFDDLVKAIRDADFALVTRATKAVNVSLTMRNWLIGHYVSEYELHGADRAEYGERVLSELSKMKRSACFTRLNVSVVEYALAGMDNNLFVSKYMLELPKKEEMRSFIEQQIKELDSENNDEFEPIE